MFPEFAVSIARVGPQEAYLAYRSKDRRLEFAAGIGRGTQFFSSRISVEVPKEMPDEDVRAIVPNLTLALGSLRYEYLVFRKGERWTIPEDQRRAAVAELRRMGCEIEPTGQEQVQRAEIANWSRYSNESKANLAKIQQLMYAARGVRENIEVLARSTDKA